MTTTASPPSKGLKVLLGLAAFVIVIAGLKSAAPLVVPFLLALFITILCAPPMAWLQEKGMPAALALTGVLASVAIGLLILVSLLQSSVNGFGDQLPFYQQQLEVKLAALLQWLEGIGLAVPQHFISDNLDPKAALKMAGATLTGFGNALSNTFLILLTVMFLLAEASSFPAKFRRFAENPEQLAEQSARIVRQINHYMAIKALMSAGTGILVWLGLWLIGIDFPALWGLLAFLLNFVPTIGSILAAIPAVLIALIQASLGDVMLVIALYFAVNTGIGNLLEPMLMGQKLGLSTLVIFLSLVFWGWVLGPVGMLLSVPLTMTLKIALEGSPNTQFWAVMLGPCEEK